MTTQPWALQDAKARLSELVKKAQKNPQLISIRGNPVVVVISHDEYKTLTTPRVSLVDFFRRSPLVGLRLEFTRDKSPGRDVEL